MIPFHCRGPRLCFNGCRSPRNIQVLRDFQRSGASCRATRALVCIVVPQAVTTTDQSSSKKGDGLLAGSASCFAFLPASTFASPADVSTWSQTKPDSEPDLFPELDPTVRKGIEKQYELLRRWAKDDKQPFGQYALPF